jgi:hypothetical protein
MEVELLKYLEYKIDKLDKLRKKMDDTILIDKEIGRYFALREAVLEKLEKEYGVKKNPASENVVKVKEVPMFNSLHNQEW